MTQRLLYLSADPGVPVRGRKGASVHLRALATALCDEGVEVTVVSPRIEPAGDEIDTRVQLRSLMAVLPKEHADEQSLRAAVEAQRAELAAIVDAGSYTGIYERFSLFSDAGVVCAQGAGLPHVLEVNAPLRQEAAKYRTLPHPDLAATIEHDVLTGTGQVLAVSAELAAFLIELGAPAERVSMLPNAVDPDAVVPRDSAREAGVVVAGFAGSLKAWHGIDTLVAAARIALAEAAELRIEIVGEGPCDHMFDESGIPRDRLVVHGSRSHGEVIELLTTWHIGLAPYHAQQTFYFSPLKVLEYMSAGLCSIASDVGQVPWLLDGGACGMLVPPGDADALAAALVRATRDASLRTSMGSAARERAVADFSWRSNARRAIEALGRETAVQS